MIEKIDFKLPLVPPMEKAGKPKETDEKNPDERKKEREKALQKRLKKHYKKEQSNGIDEWA